VYDQSFSAPALERMLRKVDFRTHPFASNALFRDAVVQLAVNSANGLFPNGLSMKHLKVGKRDVYLRVCKIGGGCPSNLREIR
jgi:hypothetical protein